MLYLPSIDFLWKSYQKYPQHVSVIMDGNGRWAKARGDERIEKGIRVRGRERKCLS